MCLTPSRVLVDLKLPGEGLCTLARAGLRGRFRTFLVVSVSLGTLIQATPAFSATASG